MAKAKDVDTHVYRSKNDTKETRIGKEKMVDYVSKRTLISKDKVSDVYDAIIEYIIVSLTMNTCPDNIKIAFTKLGNIILKPHKGMKAGSTYMVANLRGERDENGNVIMEKKTCEVDQPDYLRPFMEFSEQFKGKVRERTNRW